MVVVALAHVRSGAGAWLPLKLTIQLGSQVVDLLLASFHLGLMLLFHLDQLALELRNFFGSCLVDFLFAAVLHERLAEFVFVAIEVVVGFFNLRILAGGRLEAGALDKLRNHHFVFLLDIFALLGYNQGGRGKAPGSPFGVFE